MNIKKRKRALFNQNSKNEDFTILSLFKSCGIFLIVFAVISLISILILSFIFYSTKDPTSKIKIAALISLYFSSFVCAFMMSKKNGQMFLVGGFIFGLCIIVLTLILSLFFKSEGTMQNSIILRSIIIIPTMLGGVLGGKKKEHKRKRHKIPS